ncbi:MAG: hypothetical protein IKU09_10815 [Firmicutes bacterium]|nr:hypothetical protein [Bacillota bacterium]
MYNAKVFKILVFIQILFSILPWFDMGNITPAYWGIGKIEYMGIPFVFIIHLLWSDRENKKLYHLMIGEMSFMLIMAIQINAFIHCRKLMWVDELTDWNSCVDVTLPTFWICLLLSIVNLTIFPFVYFNYMKK